jgi:hypothetical protein
LPFKEWIRIASIARAIERPASRSGTRVDRDPPITLFFRPILYIPGQGRTAMTTAREHNKYICEQVVKGTYDEQWDQCAIPNERLDSILAVTGYGHVRLVTRMSQILGKRIDDFEQVTTGQPRALVKSKGLGFESLHQVNISSDLHERWLDKLGKKIKNINVDIPLGGDETRLFIQINEPAMKKWKAKHEPAPPVAQLQY